MKAENATAGQNGAKAEEKTTKKKNSKPYIKSVLAWSHVFTISMLALAAIVNIGSLIAIICDASVADGLTEFSKAWQGFFIAGILGYDAKSAVENVLKIQQQIETVQKNAQGDDNNG